MTSDMYKRLGLDKGRCDGKFGVEIEVDGENLPRAKVSKDFDKYWKVEHDSSIKGKIEDAEYVFKQPLSLVDTKKALDVMEARFVELDSVVNEAVKAGVHTHLNIQSYTPLELLTLITTYYLLEDHFVHWAGKSRVGNHFCLRAKDAEAVVYKIIKTCETRDWRHLNTDNIRYASLNLNAMHKYGSIEFRSMRSTRNLDVIYRWVELIDQLEKGAKKFASPRQVIESFSELNAGNNFVEFVMEDLAHEFIPLNIDMRESMEVIQPLAYMIEWDKFNKEKVNPFL